MSPKAGIKPNGQTGRDNQYLLKVLGMILSPIALGELHDDVTAVSIVVSLMKLKW